MILNKNFCDTARTKEFDDALIELKMWHDVKNRDYVNDADPYQNFNRARRINIIPWHGIVMRLMDKIEKVEGFCLSRSLASKSESMVEVFKDIAIYSTLAMILYRKDREGSLTDEERERDTSPALLLAEEQMARNFTDEQIEENKKIAERTMWFEESLDKIHNLRRMAEEGYLHTS